jgi:hypothetical protein
MNLIIESDQDPGTAGVSDIQVWAAFNQIAHHYRSFWDPENKIFTLWPDISNSVVIWHHDTLQKFMASDCALNDMVGFFNRNNRLWVLGMDHGYVLCHKDRHDQQHRLVALDRVVPKHRMCWFLDAKPAPGCWTESLQNIKISPIAFGYFIRELLRVQAPTVAKNSTAHDYMLTTILKKNRPHRDALWRELSTRPKLLDQGLISCRSDRHETWLGRTSNQHSWQDGHASMDLYSNCYLEIVPETCHQEMYYFTEKIRKPILTQTPFLVVSTPGYLQYLRDLGFQTFHDLIDESYDKCEHMEQRVRMIVDLLQELIKSGMRKFYENSQDILIHNHRRLSEIAGNWNYEFDKIIWSEWTNV